MFVFKQCGIVLFISCLAYALTAQDTTLIQKLKTELGNENDENKKLSILHSLCIDYFEIDYRSTINYGRLAIEIANRLRMNNETIADCYYWVGYALEKTEHFSEALTYLFPAQSFYKESTNTYKLALTEEEISVTCYYLAKFDEALTYANSALAGYETINNDTGRMEILTHLGYVYQSRLNSAMALKCFSQSLNIAERAHHRYYQSANLIAIGLFYVQRKEFEQAKIYYDKSVALLDKTNDKVLLAKYYSVLGLINTQLKNYNEAMKDLDYSIRVLSAVKDYNALCYAYQNMGDLYNILNKPQRALQYELLSLNAFQHTTNDEGIADQNYNIGYTFQLLHKKDSALFYFTRGLSIAEQKHFQAVRQKCYGILAELYAEKGDFKNAFLFKKNYEEIKDTLAEQNNKNKLTEFQTQFETERKEKEIALLKKDQQLSQASLQKQRTFQYAAYIIFFLLILIGFLVINRYRTVQRAKRMIEMEQMRNNIARNLHDDIGSTLTSINILSKVALQTESNDAAKTNMQKIKDRSAAIMESMNDIVWAINPANDALDKIILRMKEFGSETAEHAGMQFLFEEKGELNDVKLSLAQRNNLYLIFKEVLNNAIKYSKAKEVSIVLKKEPGNLILKIEDNGTGFDVNKQFSGNGLKNMQSRAADMNASLQMQSMPGSGTTVSLMMPIP